MVDYKYDLPTASPLDDYPQWVGLVWASIHAHLDHPYSWDENDASQALQYIDDLYDAILLPPPSSGGGAVRLLGEGTLTVPQLFWVIPVPPPSGVKRFRLVLTGQHEGVNTGNFRVRFSDPTGDWFRQQAINTYLQTSLDNRLVPNLDMFHISPSIIDDPNESGVAVIDIYNPENTDRYTQFFVQATFGSRYLRIGGVWEQTQAVDYLFWASTWGDLSIGSSYRLYGYY